jgi:hypothetical protein
VKALLFIFSYIDGQTVLCLAGHELVWSGYGMTRALLLPLALFSLRVQICRRFLTDVISIAMNVLQKSSLINNIFGTSKTFENACKE